MIKNKIQENIISPSFQNKMDANMVATVTKIDEKNNVCSIKYIDKDGYISNKDNVQVKIYNESFIDWFPQVGEMVNIEQKQEYVYITSKFEGAYTSSVRPNLENKKDILSDSFFDSINGFIL